MGSQPITFENAIAGIVTYNPEIGRLKENITALSGQVSMLLVTDNGSGNYDEIEHLCSSIDGMAIHIIRNEKNEGIAAALAQIMEWADKNLYKWVLTLDQDSVIEPGLVAEYIKTANDDRYGDVAMLTCLIHDRNFKDEKYERQDAPVIEVPYCITSASFTNVAMYKRTSGYDRSFFIDFVDFDICYLLREAGYRILRINYNGLYHEVGHGENRYFLWKRIVVYHQKAFRIYYLARNIVWMHKKHPHTFGSVKMLKKLLALFTRIVLYEDDRKEKLRRFCKGISDAGRYGKVVS